MESINHPRRTFVKGTLALSALGVLAPATAWAAAAAGGWILLGTRSVSLAGEKSLLPVTFLAGAFTHLQLRVSGNAVTMNELKLRFSNGEWVTLPVRARIRDGGQTRAIPLPGDRRYISIVELHYRSAANGKGRATVEVWGQR